MGARRNFRRGGKPKKAPIMEKKVAKNYKAPTWWKNAPHNEKNVTKKPHMKKR